MPPDENAITALRETYSVRPWGAAPSSRQNKIQGRNYEYDERDICQQSVCTSCLKQINMKWEQKREVGVTHGEKGQNE